MLIPFQASACDMPAYERMQADRELQDSTRRASCAAATIIALGSKLTSSASQLQLKEIVEKVEPLLPNHQCQRLIVSYSWLMLATLKVTIIIHVILYFPFFFLHQFIETAGWNVKESTEQLWNYFTTTVIMAISSYQLESVQGSITLTKDGVEELLQEAVSTASPSTVCLSKINIY